MMALSFAFDADNETPDSIARRRELILALQPQFGNADTVGEGIGQALTGAAMGLGQWKANKAESAGRAAGAERWQGILGALGGGSVPSAPAANPSPASVGSVSPPEGMREGIISTAHSLGIDPVDLATAISYETAGTFDPTKAGPTTKWGQHRGLIQFGEPQAKQYGVDWNNAVGSQLGPDGAVAKYLRDTGVKPGMGLLDVYSAINAGGVGRYGASDANNGGAPGTVADKVNNQMASHKQKALALLGDLSAQPAQVASLDPSVGMPQQPGAIPGTMDQSNAGAPQGPGAPGEIRQGADGRSWQYVETAGMANATGPQGWIPVNTQQQVAQAMIAPNNPGNIGMPDGQGNIVQAQGAFPPAPPAPQAGPNLQQLIEAAGDPWLPEAARPILDTLIEQHLRPKEFGFQSGRDGAIFRTDPRTGTIEQVYGGKPDTFRVLSPEEEVQMGLDPAGAYQIGADNKVSKIGGEGTTVNIDQKTEGAFDKKLAEKDAETYSTMSTEGMNAKADLGIIGELETLLQGQGGTLTGLQGMLAQRGIDVGNATSDLQAAQALINKLVPTQRQPGSGSMSDRDVELFTRSLPSLWNQPGGNQRILSVMRGLAQYKAEQGRISDMVLTGEISRQDARKMLQELPNPLEGIKVQSDLPDGVTEEDLQHTMKVHGLSREEVLKRLQNAP